MKLARVLTAFGLIALTCAAFVSFVRYTSCDTNLSEDDVVLDVARGHIEKEIDFLVRHFKEPAADVLAGKFVLLSTFDTRFNPFSVMYQTPRGQLVDMEITVTCGVLWSYPHRIQPSEVAMFTRDLRTGQPFVQRSTVSVTGVLSEPGTNASHSGAIQLPREAVRP